MIERTNLNAGSSNRDKLDVLTQAEAALMRVKVELQFHDRVAEDELLQAWHLIGEVLDAPWRDQ